ncbi:MAG: hypothetical protein Q9225_006726, partial [Loekoesia sp. 1 TL-2023]
MASTASSNRDLAVNTSPFSSTTASESSPVPSPEKNRKPEETQNDNGLEIDDDKLEYCGLGERNDVVWGKRRNFLVEKKVTKKWMTGV